MHSERRFATRPVRIRRPRPKGRLIFTILTLAGLSVFGYFALASLVENDNDLTCAVRTPVARMNSPELTIDRAPQTSIPENTKSLAAPDKAPEDCKLELGAVEILGASDQGDTLTSLFKLNIPSQETALKLAKVFEDLIRRHKNSDFRKDRNLKSGRRYNLLLDKDGGFLKAVLEMDPAHVFYAVNQNGEIKAWKEDVVLDYKIESIAFKIKNNLYSSIRSVGEGRELAWNLEHIFKWDIDFSRELMRGDTCKIVFERRYADDRPSGYGKILFAEYDGRRTGRKTAALFKKAYWDIKGYELKKDFLVSPLEIKLRVTSKYGMRFHPILKRRKMHKGVDYGAPTGTPIVSVARGEVVYAGYDKGGYGNYIKIRHKNGIETRYGHLSRNLVRKGQIVKQGQKIGLVGATGRATGPHLDFQFLIKGKHIDPLKMKYATKNDRERIPKPLRPRFFRLTGSWIATIEKNSPGSNGPKYAVNNRP